MKSTVLFNAKRRGLWITRLMARDGDRCGICLGELDRAIRDPGSPEYITFDHVIPSSRGGLDVISNLRLAHQQCNRDRGNEYPPAPKGVGTEKPNSDLDA